MLGIWIVVSLLTIFAMFPFYWMLITSVKSDKELYMGKHWYISVEPTLHTYFKLFRQTNFVTYYKNSLLVTGVTIPVALAISILAAYSLTRLKWPGQSTMRAGVLVTYAMPVVILAIPFYVILNLSGLIDNLFGLILVYLTSVVPFCTWFLMGYLQGMPTNVEDAARIDGCGHLSLITRILIL
jgi:multiple sugar transport system permease protein